MSYVVVGAGPAGVIASETLSRRGHGGNITLVSGEPEAPYSRMAIPYLLAEDIAEEGTHLRHSDGHYENLGIAVQHERVASIDAGAKSLSFESGGSMGYDKLLLATGATPVRPLIAGMDLKKVMSCWTLEDARGIIANSKPGDNVVLMGAGFIGCIILEALVARKVNLTVIEMEDRMVARMMDKTGGDMISAWCNKQGVNIMTSTRVTGVSENSDGTLTLDLDGKDPIGADLVVCATGVKSNMGFLEGSGINTDMGVLINEHMETSLPDIYAAGDVAAGFDLMTGKHDVHAIQPTASEHGRIAATNMAGNRTAYRGSLVMNTLNTLGLISTSYGLWDGTEGGDESVSADKDRSKYLRLSFKDDVMVGVLGLGITQHVGVLRGLIQTRTPLGKWKDVLMEDPHQFMSAYLACAQDASRRAA
ncbi:MAG: NAD(P)/FAD-dependent oxidoreductase [Rhodospirillaceae bacterium]|jgi:NAD(P)H-nitrite reductase large subunit|nr:NAD(P)/FAD-dependent oxidoreductase [Rhodospirillaceae bacterium]MBT6203581.1 NAD(P)/FAD-dependent oxidoreductase [Rhodospirillaceae bacterium]MBT7615378.1 NAD(P)/FAD-dependent oxidoreductase [Rhodospirillaceae bacterium]MBT7645679.1 NAD(P)/FAD-dependent oxidoreductase [Rhodospirillaceae bacterium]